MRNKLILASMMLVLAGLLAVVPVSGAVPVQASPEGDEPVVTEVADALWSEFVAALEASEYWKRLSGLHDATLTDGLDVLAPAGFEIQRNFENSIELLTGDGPEFRLSGGRVAHLVSDSVGDGEMYTTRYILSVAQVDAEGDWTDDSVRHFVPASRLLPISFDVLTEIRLVHPLNQRVNLSTSGRSSKVMDVLKNLCRDARLDYVLDESQPTEIAVQLRNRTVIECIQHVCTASGYTAVMSAKGIISGQSTNEVESTLVNQNSALRLDRRISMDMILSYYSERETLLATRRVSQPIETIADAMQVAVAEASKRLDDNRVLLSFRYSSKVKAGE